MHHKTTWLLGIALLMLAMAAAHVVYSTHYPSTRSQSSQQKTRELLRVAPVHELILQEATLDIITQAKFDAQGYPVLYFASAGAFGQTASKTVLFRGCVRIRYGVDMAERRLEITSDNNGSILLKLPQPRIIGTPVILTEEPYQSRILDVQGEGWWAGRIARAEVTNQIAQAYVQNAARLCDGLGLEHKTKERAEQVLRAFLKPMMDGSDLVIQWETKETPETGKQQGVVPYGDREDVEKSTMDTRDGSGGDWGGAMEDAADRLYADTEGDGCDDDGFTGDAEFRVAREPFYCVPDGPVGPGGAGWVQGE